MIANSEKHLRTNTQEVLYNSHSNDECLRYCNIKNEKKVTRVAAITFFLSRKNTKKPAAMGNNRSGKRVFSS